ncbi:metallophosphoesterase [Paracoccus aminophilus]|uniref:Serine/threonine protein phosphatase 1 n=1 Tax=Paracoccus aminophilus JCM 7686 TaxID=1367847 RepID=S5Y366_PARAH|nr:metallophosphoesterase [Paracoccus aminophilus]AGT10190.1 serine/threonine protein phosphatase 1 [Paracoccus aminophilus JCM 7686]
MPVFAIGDIHGELEMLRAAHRRIERIAGRDAEIVHVGDLLDRGPDSRGVVDYLRDGQLAGRNWVVVKGNHDRFLPKFILEPEWIDPSLTSGRHWIDHDALGAPATLASYGVDIEGPRWTLHERTLQAVPREHIDWLTNLPLWHLRPEALFVHAGIRPGVDLGDQIEQDLVWIRPEFLNDPRDHGILVVHGHTPVKTVEHHGNRLAIDTGAVFGGTLSAVEISDEAVHLVTEDGRAPILPLTKGR